MIRATKIFVVGVIIASTAVFSTFYASRPATTFVFTKFQFEENLDEAGIEKFYLRTDEGGVKSLIEIENGTTLTGEKTFDGYGYRRSSMTEAENFTVSSNSTIDIDVEEDYSTFLEHQYEENFTEDFVRNVNHTFTANFTDRYAAYMNYSYRQNFSDHVYDEFSRHIVENYSENVTDFFEASGETETAFYYDVNAIEFNYTSPYATAENRTVLSQWLDFRSKKPYSWDTGNFTRVTCFNSTAGTTYRNGTGYMTLSDTSTTSKTYLSGKSGAVTNSYTQISNRSEQIKYEIKWRLRNAGGTYPGAIFYVDEYNNAGTGLRTTTIASHAADFGWVTESKVISAVNGAGLTKTQWLSFTVLPASAWQNDATGNLDVEYIKIYRKRFMYDVNYSLSVPLGDMHEEFENVSWMPASMVVFTDISFLGCGSVNKWDYDFDRLTCDGSTQNAPKYYVPKTVFDNYSEFAVGFDGWKIYSGEDEIGPGGIWSELTNNTICENGYAYIIHPYWNDTVENFTVDINFNVLTLGCKVNVSLGLLTTFCTKNWSVEHFFERIVNWTYDEWVNNTVDVWVNNTVGIDFDLYGLGNYTYYDLETNATAREEINFVLTSLTETYFSEYFEEIVSYTFSVLATDYYSTWVNYTFTYSDIVNTTTTVDVSYGEADYGEYVIERINVTTTTVTRTLTQLRTSRISEVMEITKFREFRTFDLDETYVVDFRSWNCYVVIRLYSYNVTDNYLDIGFERVYRYIWNEELGGPT